MYSQQLPQCSTIFYISASPWETRRLKAELTEARTQIASLEVTLNREQALRRETELLFEQKNNALQLTVERDRIKVSFVLGLALMWLIDKKKYILIPHVKYVGHILITLK